MLLSKLLDIDKKGEISLKKTFKGFFQLKNTCFVCLFWNGSIKVVFCKPKFKLIAYKNIDEAQSVKNNLPWQDTYIISQFYEGALVEEQYYRLFFAC